MDLSERQRGAQLEAPGPLLLRDGDCSKEGDFGSGRIGGVLLDEGFAANAVEVGVVPALTCTFGKRNPLFETFQGRFEVAALRFGVGEGAPQEAVENNDILLLKQLEATAHSRPTACMIIP